MPNPSMTSLRNAVATQEGYGASPYNNPTRNNNPGDIKNSSGGFTVYPSIEAGTAALDHQLNIIATGQSPVYNEYAKSLGLKDSSELTLSQVGAKYSPDGSPWAVGVGRVLGVDPSSTKMADIISGRAQVNQVAPPGGGFKTQDPPGSRTPTNPSEPPAAPIVPSTTAQQITGSTLPPDFVTGLDPKLQIDYGTDEMPWYNDPALVTGNPHLRKSTRPITFSVYLDREQPSVQLKNARTNEPLQLQLNCSLREYSIESKHVFTRTPSRTGMHITFWGMTPDLISGQGSTGVFMNQFGLTDWFSVANVSDEMKDAVLNGMIQTAFPALAKSTNAQPYSPDDIYSYVVQKQAPVNPSEAFRVAAQDAFVEFMKLFQMNGVVWFTNPNYTGYQTGMEQQGPNAWGSNKPGAFATGSTSFQQAARNNDVMTRGYVALKIKNSVYLGYFKSLNWTQDAEKPFVWDFTFVFQVEKTVSALFYSDAGVTVGNFVNPTTSTITG